MTVEEASTAFHALSVGEYVAIEMFIGADERTRWKIGKIGESGGGKMFVYLGKEHVFPAPASSHEDEEKRFYYCSVVAHTVKRGGSALRGTSLPQPLALNDDTRTPPLNTLGLSPASPIVVGAPATTPPVPTPVSEHHHHHHQMIHHHHHNQMTHHQQHHQHGMLHQHGMHHMFNPFAGYPYAPMYGHLYHQHHHHHHHHQQQLPAPTATPTTITAAPNDDAQFLAGRALQGDSKTYVFLVPGMLRVAQSTSQQARVYCMWEYLRPDLSAEAAHQLWRNDYMDHFMDQPPPPYKPGVPELTRLAGHHEVANCRRVFAEVLRASHARPPVTKEAWRAPLEAGINLLAANATVKGGYDTVVGGAIKLKFDQMFGEGLIAIDKLYFRPSAASKNQ